MAFIKDVDNFIKSSFSNLPSSGNNGAVTVIVCDIVGYKNMIKQQDKNVMSAITRVFSKTIKEQALDRVYLDKDLHITFAGDAVIIMCETEYKNEVNMMASITIWLNGLRALISKRVDDYFSFSFQYGIGVYTSDDNVIINVGDKEKSDVTIIGDAIVEAMKLAKKANRNSYKPIIISDTTFVNLTGQSKKQYEKYSRKTSGGDWETDMQSDNFKDYLDND